MRKPGLAPIRVAPVCAARRHCQRRSGCSGLPSIITIEARTSRPETSAFHIIQAVVENQRIRSPAWRSQLSAWFFRCSSRIPPWLCTIAFGLPVVPEEKSTHRGWSNGTGSTPGSPGLGQQLVPAERVGQGVPAVGHLHHGLDGRQSGAELSDLLAAVDVLAAVAVSRDDQQHLRLDLAEAVDHAAGAELGGAARPDRPEARRWPGTPPASRGCSAGRPRRGRPVRRPGAAAPRGPWLPGRAAHPR